MKAPVPSDEAERLRVLRRYRILDTPPERSYDDIVRLAGSICGASVAFISLVDEYRQWFKAKLGLDAEETSRDISFCAHTVMDNDLMVVADARQDERFAESPLTQSAPHIRFYAGMPLVTPEGCSVGALCVVDREPRTLSQEQADALRALGRQVVHLLELRRSAASLAEALEQVKVLRGLLPICAHCKRIRDDAGYWIELENHVRNHTDTEFTHGICPSCAVDFLGLLKK